MGLFNNDNSVGNSGTAGGGFTVTGRGKWRIKAIRKESTSPSKGGSGRGAKTRRPGQSMGGDR